MANTDAHQREKNQWLNSPIGIGDTLQRARFPLACIFALKFFILRKAPVGFAIHPLGSDQQTAEGLMKPKRTILCVDDNEQSLSHRKIMLETRGYRVANFSRGEDALARFQQGGIDLVIADMAMPGLDGPQLIAKIKEVSPYTPAILISSKVRIYDHESKADVFLAKGMYAPVDLLERVRLLLIRKRGPKRLQQRPMEVASQIGAA
jgi:two-component system, OmpR family, response regulator CpxR